MGVPMERSAAPFFGFSKLLYCKLLNGVASGGTSVHLYPWVTTQLTSNWDRVLLLAFFNIDLVLTPPAG